MSLLALFASLALIACASTSKPCCTPKRYSSKTFIQMYTNGVFSEGKGTLFFDADIGMTASFTYYGTNSTKNGKFLVSTYLNISSDYMYVVYKGHCTRIKSDKTWLEKEKKANCIPGNAKLTNSFVLGGHHEDVELSEFKLRINSTQLEFLVTTNHCFPVQEIVIGDKTANGVSELFYKINMVDIIPTVRDPTVFVVPAICTTTPLSTEENIDSNWPIDPRDFVPKLARY